MGECINSEMDMKLGLNAMNNGDHNKIEHFEHDYENNAITKKIKRKKRRMILTVNKPMTAYKKTGVIGLGKLLIILRFLGLNILKSCI